METFKRHEKEISGILFITLIVILGYFSFHFVKKKLVVDQSDQVSKSQSEVDDILGQAARLHEIWSLGEKSQDWLRVKEKCVKKFKLIENFTENQIRCHPIILSCLKDFDKKNIWNFDLFENGELYQWVSKSINPTNLYDWEQLPSSGYRIKFRAGQKTLQFVLSDRCHESLIAERVYSYGKRSPRLQDDYHFDTFNRKILIDKYLVNEFQVYQWKRSRLLFLKKQNNNTSANEEAIRSLDRDISNQWDLQQFDPFKPATQLKIEEMKNYCRDHGGDLLSAPLYDAASFWFDELQDRNGYYWLKGSKVNASKVEMDCQKLYSKECLQNANYKVGFYGPSASGVFDIQGGILEALKNPLEKNKNLKLSSKYFAWNAPEQMLAERGEWNGQDFSLSALTMVGSDVSQKLNSTDKLEIGFRCYREL